ncbi:MAG: MBL fold metallo-hydrolase [Clostridiales Family XIII bacterium]|jgi:glyoxylase-like metal-dependent hydrolase (beta-lactamase superfamily II)|nr:MBL fold metallo-hydrolase [Clostridiales Family XIII bacterium]
MAYSITKIADGVHAIDEDRFVQCFLIEGDDCAVLFDSCASGGADFKTAFLSLTGKPIKLVLSHSDHDHTGGQECFHCRPLMHPAEYARYFSKGNAGRMVGPLWEGEVLDLGGVKLEAALIPGHTPGSIALLDRANRRLFVGDTVSDAQIHMFGDGRDLMAFIESLRKLEAMAALVDTVHPAHGSPVLRTEWFAKTRVSAEKLLNGELEPKEPPSGLPCKRYSFDGVNLLYIAPPIKCCAELAR